MHVMGVLEGVIQCSPLIIVPTKGQMWNLNNHLTHLTNHSPNPSFLVRCDVFADVSFFQLQVRSLFLTIKSNKKVSTGPFQGIHPHSLFKAPDMIFHFPFSSGFLTCCWPWGWVRKQQRRVDGWFLSLHEVGMVTIIRIPWVRWKGSKTSKNRRERHDDGDVEGKKLRPHLSCSTICLKGDGDVKG